MVRPFFAAFLLFATAACGQKSAPTAPPPPTTFTLSGQITDSASGTGISGATVSLTDGPDAGKSTTTTTQGSYTLSGLQPSSLTVAVSDATYVAQSKRPHPHVEPSALVPTGDRHRHGIEQLHTRLHSGDLPRLRPADANGRRLRVSHRPRHLDGVPTGHDGHDSRVDVGVQRQGSSHSRCGRSGQRRDHGRDPDELYVNRRPQSDPGDQRSDVHHISDAIHAGLRERQRLHDSQFRVDGHPALQPGRSARGPDAECVRARHHRPRHHGHVSRRRHSDWRPGAFVDGRRSGSVLRTDCVEVDGLRSRCGARRLRIGAEPRGDEGGIFCASA